MTGVGDDALIGQMRAAYAAGLCILPVASDGSKKPGLSTWKEYQRKRPTTAQMRAWGMRHRSGYGMVAGTVSGHREAWDFDDLETYHDFLAEAELCGLGEVVRRISRATATKRQRAADGGLCSTPTSSNAATRRSPGAVAGRASRTLRC